MKSDFSDDDFFFSHIFKIDFRALGVRLAPQQEENTTTCDGEMSEWVVRVNRFGAATIHHERRLCNQLQQVWNGCCVVEKHMCDMAWCVHVFWCTDACGLCEYIVVSGSARTVHQLAMAI